MRGRRVRLSPLGQHWGTTPAEQATPLPCDDLLPDAQLVTRAVDVDADPATAFRWLCQLRAAPYSYDKLDNLGKRSPQELTPGLEKLEVGQRFMTVFRLASFVDGEHLTLTAGGRLSGRFAVTYAAPPGRLVMRMRAEHPGPRPERVARAAVFPALDLIMARRQLLNLSALAAIAQRTSR